MNVRIVIDKKVVHYFNNLCFGKFQGKDEKENNWWMERWRPKFLQDAKARVHQERSGKAIFSCKQQFFFALSQID